jgi:ATP-dependent exoDNAse (exonuclease V) alpha subunit
VTYRNQDKLSGSGIAAYIGGEKTYCERTLRQYDWSHRTDVIEKGVVVPEDAPKWARDMNDNGDLIEFGRFLEDEEDRYIQRYHRARGEEYIEHLKTRAMTDFRVQVDIPKELNQTQASAFVKEFLKEAYADKGMMVGYAIHWDDGNPHAHIFGSTRKLSERGLGARHAAFSKYGEREGELRAMRETFAKVGNRHLEAAGYKPRLDHRSYADQGIDMVPTIHEGAAARMIAARGEDSELVKENERRRAENLMRLEQDLSPLINEIARYSSAWTEAEMKSSLFRAVGHDAEAFEKLAPKLMAHPMLEVAGKDIRGNLYYTIASNTELEGKFLKEAAALKGQVREDSVDRKTANEIVRSKYAFLLDPKSAQQLAALDKALDNQRMTVITGRAGVGKTTLFQAAAAIYEAEGFNLRGFSMAGAAADNLEAQTGISSRTLDSFNSTVKNIAELEQKAETMRSLLKPHVELGLKTDYSVRIFARSPFHFKFNRGLKIVSPIGVKWKPSIKVKPKIVREGERDLLALERQIARLKSSITFDKKTVLVVDEAGMAGNDQVLPLLKAANESGAKIIFVGDGQQFKAIAAGDSLRHLASIADSTATINVIRRQDVIWQADATLHLSEGRVRDALTLYETNGRIVGSDTVDQARNQLVDHYFGVKDREGLKASDQMILAFTNADVTALNSMIRDRMTQRGELTDPVTIRGKEFAVGDRVVFTTNRTKSDHIRDLSGQHHKVRNGTFADLASVEKDPERDTVFFRLRLAGGDEIRVDANAMAPELMHAFANTYHKSQGQTVPYTWILASELPRDDAAYVALSRQVKDAMIFWSKDRFEDLKDMVARWERPAYKALLYDFEKFRQDPVMFKTATTYVQARMEAGRLAAEITKDIQKNGGAFYSHALFPQLKQAADTRKSTAGEILQHWDRHALAITQGGLTIDRVREDAGAKQRQELPDATEATERVKQYAQLDRDSRDLLSEMRKTHPTSAIVQHPRHPEYVALKDARDQLTLEMLKAAPTHRRQAARNGVSWTAVKTQAGAYRERLAKESAMLRLKSSDAGRHELLSRYRSGRQIAQALKLQGEGRGPEYLTLLAENEKRAAFILHGWDSFEGLAAKLGLADKLLVHHAARGEIRIAIEAITKADTPVKLEMARAGLAVKLDRLAMPAEKFAAAVARDAGVDWKEFRRDHPRSKVGTVEKPSAPIARTVDIKESARGSTPPIPETLGRRSVDQIADVLMRLSPEERRSVEKAFREQISGLDSFERSRAVQQLAGRVADLRTKNQAGSKSLGLTSSLVRLAGREEGQEAEAAKLVAKMIVKAIIKI